MKTARWFALRRGFLAGLLFSANPQVVMETSMGTVKIELFASKAPATVKNFLQYVDDKHFDETVFHRVISKFMIQGGGFTAEMVEKPERAPIKNESSNGLLNVRGTLAMARTGDPHSAGAKFFINVVDNGFLDRERAEDRWGYAVFAKVIDGMNVVDKIRYVDTTTRGGHGDVPKEPVIIKSIRRIEKKE